VSGRGGPLGSAKTARPTIADGATQRYTVEVPAGASRLEVKIGSPSDLEADLDLTVLHGGVVVGQSAGSDSEEQVMLANPAPGSYTVEVDGYDVPAGSTAYDYRDVFYAGALGTLRVGGAPVELGHGEAMTVSGTVTAETRAAAGRELFGEMTVVTEEGAVVGRGGVVIRAVSG
jgi:hypothetical protein